MARPARRGCPASAVLLLTLVVVQLLLCAVSAAEAWAWVLATVALLLVLPISWGLWTGCMRESRFFAVLVAGCVGGAHVLAATLGAPGGEPLGWSPGRALIVSLAVVAVLVVLWRAGVLTLEGGSRAVRDPYASGHVTPAAGRGGRRRDRRSSAADVGA